MSNQERYPFPTRFFIEVKEGWDLAGSDLKVGDVLMVEPYEDPKIGGLHYFRLGGNHVRIGWMYEQEGRLMLLSITGPPRFVHLSDTITIADHNGTDVAVYPINDKVCQKDPVHQGPAADGGSAVNDLKPKGGSE